MADSNTRRIVLLGKTGSGKSSLANTLFGESDVFQVNHLPNSGTKVCMSRTKTVNGRSLQLIDTPGFFDTDPRSTELSPALLECITECAPGPHAFLLVLKIEKYTLLEQAIVALMLSYFSEDVLKYTTVVFTRGDDLPVGMKIEEWVEQNEDLKNLVQKCGSRCHVIDNKYWNNSQDPYRNDQFQIEELLKTIDQTVKENKGEHYTNDMLTQVDAEIQQQVALISKSLQNVSPMDIIQKAKEFVLRNWKGIGLVIGGILGAFIGGIAVSAIAVTFGVPCFWTCVLGVVVGGVLGGLAGWALGRALMPAEREAQRKAERKAEQEAQREAERKAERKAEQEAQRKAEQYIKDVELLWDQLQKIRPFAVRSLQLQA